MGFIKSRIERMKGSLQNIKVSVTNYLFTIVFFLLVLIASGFGFYISKGLTLLLLYAGTAIVLGLVFQIRFRSAPASETNVREIRAKIKELQEKLHEEQLENSQLRYDIKNQRTRLLKMDWIWEINISKIEHERQKVFNYLKQKRDGTLVNWAEKNDGTIKRGDRRMLGVLRTGYSLKAGVDLRSLRVSEVNGVLKCSNPVISITGVSDLQSSWEIKVELRLGGIAADTWMLVDPDQGLENMDMEFWEGELKKAIESASQIDSIEPSLLNVVTSEAKTRITNLLSYVSGLRVEFVDPSEPELELTLGEFVDQANQVNERMRLSETS